MKFLVDESLSFRVAEALTAAGHEAVHATNIGLAGAPDEDVMSRAQIEARVLVSADTDFGELLALGRHALPSLVLFRRERRSPAEQARVLLENFDQIDQALADGAIVVFEAHRIRVRALPIA